MKRQRHGNQIPGSLEKNNYQTNYGKDEMKTTPESNDGPCH